MKKILLIQSRQNADSIAAEQEQYRRAIGDAAELEALSVLEEKLAWTTPDEILAGYDGVILGGSGEFDLHGGRTEKDPLRIMATIILTRLRAFISYILSADIPTLGICFGHQLIGQMRGGDIENDEAQKKVGTHDTELTSDGKKDRLFKVLPASFGVHYAHHDSITEMPGDAVLLASGDACRFSALRYGKNVYTTQFHPEFTVADVAERLKHTPGYIPAGVAPESIFRDTPDASKIIPLWVEKVVEA